MPRPKVFTIGLSAVDREFLVKLTTSGTHPARMIMRARTLLSQLSRKSVTTGASSCSWVIAEIPSWVHVQRRVREHACHAPGR